MKQGRAGRRCWRPKKEEMKAKARVEVQRFLDGCKINDTVLPRDVAKWMGDNSTHPVIWHMPDRKYRFASELHAEAAEPF